MPDKIKVLVASSLHVWDDPRIYYKQCSSLAKYYDLTLMAISEDNIKIADNMRIIGLKKPLSLFARLIHAVQIWTELIHDKYKIFHFHDPELLWVGFLAKIAGKKVIMDIHENILGVVQIRNWIPGWLRIPLGKLFLFLENLGQLIFDGTILAEASYQKYFKSDSKTVIIQNFVKVNSERIVESMPVKPKIVYVGDVTFSRGITELMEAVIELQKSDRNISLNIIGKLPEEKFRKQLELIRATAPFPEQIMLTGYVNFKQLKHFVSDAMLGVVPLHSSPNYLHSFPTKIFDYMNWGLPFVYSDLPFWVKTFSETSGGLKFKAGDKKDLLEKITQVIYNKEAWNKQASDGRKNIAKFSWTTEEKKLLHLYKNIC